MIAVIDYGMGNIHSVKKGLELFGAKVVVTCKADDIAKADKLVLPGVGAFDDAMQELENYGLDRAIKQAISDIKPFLGICLGMQLLFEESEEAKRKRGLGILRGRIRRFAAKRTLKVPHMGWNSLKVARSQGHKVACALLKDISDDSHVYFCHSYYPVPDDKGVIAAVCDYGGEFAAALCRGNIYGVQFHPEKSQAVGLKILENFVKLC